MPLIGDGPLFTIGAAASVLAWASNRGPAYASRGQSAAANRAESANAGRK
jgi:hypothetical protein